MGRQGVMGVYTGRHRLVASISGAEAEGSSFAIILPASLSNVLHEPVAIHTELSAFIPCN